MHYVDLDEDNEARDCTAERQDSAIEHLAVAIQRFVDSKIDWTAPNMKAHETHATRLSSLVKRVIFALSSIVKIVIFVLLLFSIGSILEKIYTQEGIVIVPFETSKNTNLSGTAIADQLTYELMWIQKTHALKFENLVLVSRNSEFRSGFQTEQSLGGNQLVVPKAEILEFNMVDVGNIDVGVGSLSLGNLIIAFKNICPGSKPVKTIRGSLQKYGSTITLVAILEGKTIQSWTLRQPVDDNNEEKLHEMIRDLAAMIAHDLKQPGIEARSWEGLEYYTEALDAYHQYNLSGNPDLLSLACNYSLKAIWSEKGYKNPYDLLGLLESKYITIGRLNDATDYCNKTIALDPTSSSAWNCKGFVLLCLGKYDQALQAYNMSIVLDPMNAATWNGKGSVYYDLHNYDQALQAYNMSIVLDPMNAATWNNKGNTFERMGKYDQALQAHNKSIVLDPMYAMPWNGKGNVYYDLHNYDQALQAYNMSIVLDPMNAATWNNKGNTFERMGKYDQALQAYNMSIVLDPMNAATWNNKGNTFERMGKYDQALQAHNKSIVLDPMYAMPWNGKGSVYYDLHNYDQALQAYNMSIVLDPMNAATWNNKGNTFERMGKYDQALQAHNKSIVLDPMYAMPWNGKGSVYYDLHNYDQALQAYNMSIVLDPMNAATWNNKGTALKSLGRTTEADAAFAKAKELGYEG